MDVLLKVTNNISKKIVTNVILKQTNSNIVLQLKMVLYVFVDLNINDSKKIELLNLNHVLEKMLLRKMQKNKRMKKFKFLVKKNAKIIMNIKNMVILKEKCYND